MSTDQAPQLDRKEWVKASRSANGQTIVSVTLQEGNLTSRWSVKAYGKIKEAVLEARSYAGSNLDQLREATEES